MCKSCNILYINGMRCHEQGCPEAWQDYDRECHECGSTYRPSERNDTICGDCWCDKGARVNAQDLAKI